MLIEREAFITPPAGSRVPDEFGAPSQQLSFVSSDRTLRAHSSACATQARRRC